MCSKMVLRILSISLALMISAILVPSTVYAKLDAKTELTIEKAVLDTPTDTTLMLGNNNPDDAITLFFLPSGDNGTCSIGVIDPETGVAPDSEEGLPIPADMTAEIIVTYQTSTTETCSGDILIYWMGGGDS